MLEDAEGSPNGTHVYVYTSGEVYSRETDPRISDEMAESFVRSGRAVAVDASGNPVGKPVDRRAFKAAQEALTPANDDPAEAQDEGYASPADQARRRRR